MNSPETITILKSEWLSLVEIATSAERLTKAVTKRMSADEPTDADVWEMFQAHGACCEKLKNRKAEK